jgi:hypothetical protein
VSIFITLCESFLGIQPHFNLWRHFFCLKKKGGTEGSKVARGAYLNLCDGMKAEYLNVPLSSSMRDWYKKWFYVQQEQEPFVACDVAQIPEQQQRWSARPTSAKMVQVEELLGMIDSKERVHPLYEYSGLGDPTRESTRNLSWEEVNWWLAQLFDLTGHRHLSSTVKAYKLITPPPQVCPRSPSVLILIFRVTGTQP